jgi:pimeloyl-ACP methyl ester carboxylesterase
MQKNYLWTALKARLQSIRTTEGKNYNWIFLPGGPGLGSESLHELTKMLHLPGTIWHLDLPGDGSNVTDNNTESFSHWSQALVQAVSALDNVILVAHSTGGMYALSTPELEKNLAGLILMDSAPNASWQQEFMEYAATHPLPEVGALHKIYTENPNNQTLKEITIASCPYFCAENCPPQKKDFLQTLPYNYQVCDWSAAHFDQTYKAQWVPKNISTLIFAGDSDCITPLALFKKAQEFQRDNIVIKSIEHAGHFPWLENPHGVVAAFQDYCQRL